MEVDLVEVEVEVFDDGEESRAEESEEDYFPRVVTEELDFEAVFDAEVDECVDTDDDGDGEKDPEGVDYEDFALE